MLILSAFLFSFGVLLTVFGAFKIGQSNFKISLDQSAQNIFAEEVRKFMEEHSTQEKIVVSIDDKIENLFNQKLKEIEISSSNKKTCNHTYDIVREGTISVGDRITGRYYDMKCKHCGSMKRERFNVDD